MEKLTIRIVGMQTLDYRNLIQHLQQKKSEQEKTPKLFSTLNQNFDLI